LTEKEKTLLAGCVKGDKVAWDAFVLQYSKLAYSTIRKTLTLHHAESHADFVDNLYRDIFLSVVKDDFGQLRRFREDRSRLQTGDLHSGALRRAGPLTI